MLITTPKPQNADLGKYYKSEKYISHTDANDSFIDKVYQLVKKTAIKGKVKSIKDYKISDNNLLDIGCGTGEFLVACKKDGWNVVGVEPNSDAKAITISKIANENLIFDSLEQVVNVSKARNLTLLPCGMS